MSVKIEVVPVKIEKHPNADLLSIVKVKGWQCVVKTSDFENVNLGAYIPIDTVLPQTEEWYFLKNYKYRVRTVKLRGILSQGLLIPAKPHWKLGDDVTEELGAKKYEPPLPVHLAGDMVRDISGFLKYINIENYKNFPSVFEEGEQVVITEKIHGTNARYGIIDGEFCVGTRTTCRNPSGENIYSRVAREHNIKDKIKNILEETGSTNIIIYGEIFGKSIQDLHYGKQHPDFMAFDIFLDGEFLDYLTFREICERNSITITPEIFVGEFLPQEHLSLSDGLAFTNTHIREGVVIKSLFESFYSEIGRKILKKISDKYLLRNSRTDFH